MRTTILVTVLLLSMLSAASAQRVEKDLFNGEHPVINCDRMSSNMYTTTSKGFDKETLKTVETNRQVYKRFAVNMSENGSRTTTWGYAFTICRSIAGGQWRLPTQRELMLMWVLKPELEKKSGFTKFSEYYHWAATEYKIGEGWLVYFLNGATYSSDNNTKYDLRVRCVRELTP